VASKPHDRSITNDQPMSLDTHVIGTKEKGRLKATFFYFTSQWAI
jgi:hypothetical protein